MWIFFMMRGWCLYRPWNPLRFFFFYSWKREKNINISFNFTQNIRSHFFFVMNEMKKKLKTKICSTSQIKLLLHHFKKVLTCAHTHTKYIKPDDVHAKCGFFFVCVCLYSSYRFHFAYTVQIFCFIQMGLFMCMCVCRRDLICETFLLRKQLHKHL